MSVTMTDEHGLALPVLWPDGEPFMAGHVPHDTQVTIFNMGAYFEVAEPEKPTNLTNHANTV